MNKLQHLLNKVNKVTSCYRHGREISNCAMDALCNAQIEFEQGGDWISVDDELPEVGLEVAVIVFYAGCMNAHNDRLMAKNEWQRFVITQVLFWQLLPEPPNSEAEDE